MKVFSFIIIISFLLINIKAQPLTLNVWNGKIPGSIESSRFKEDTIKIENGRIRIAKVSNPTITIYFPDKKKFNGSAVVICPGGGYGILSMDNEGSEIAGWLNYTALKNKGVDAELHIYPKGGHGFGLAKNGGTESAWPESCIKWLKQIGMIE